jgi:hypothetical protein
LLYHIYPVRGSLWRWNVQRLKEFWDVFTGRKIVMIVTDKRTDRPETVLKELEYPVETIVDINNPRLGETKMFLHGLGRLQSTDPNESTFYAHAKGVTHEGPTREKTRSWADALYELNLRVPRAIDNLLESYATVGALRQYFGVNNQNNWYFAGTFYWLKNDLLFKRNWNNISQVYYGVELYPGRVFKEGEGFSLAPLLGHPYTKIIKKEDCAAIITELRKLAT